MTEGLGTRSAVRLRRRWRPAGRASLKETLEDLYHGADRSTLDPDPLSLVLGYDDPRDQEVAGLLASAWAYGRADRIVQDAGLALERMGPSPARFCERLAAGETDMMRHLGTVTHRLHREGDWAAMAWMAGDLLRRWGSIGGAFAAWLPEGSADYGPALQRLHGLWTRGAYPARVRASAGSMRIGDSAHLLPDPAAGSACKRLHLWLRWMVRSDHIDPGPWHTLAPDAAYPERLLIPLDRHVARLGRYLGFTGRRSPGRQMAGEITRALSAFDPSDPVRYDFALCRLGILGLCPQRRDEQNCRGCPILRWCRL